MSHLDLSVKGNLVHDALDHGGFSFAILAHECHLLATTYGQIDMVKDHVVILLASFVTDDGIVATTLRAGKLEVQGRVVHLVYLDGDNLFQLAYALLHLNGLCCLVSEAVDEGLCIGYLLLLILEGTYLLFASLGTKVDILVVLYTIVVYSSATDFDGAIRYIVDEGTVMAHQHHGT